MIYSPTEDQLLKLYHFFADFMEPSHRFLFLYQESMQLNLKIQS